MLYEIAQGWPYDKAENFHNRIMKNGEKMKTQYLSCLDTMMGCDKVGVVKRKQTLQ